jgi:hypothetical protein
MALIHLVARHVHFATQLVHLTTLRYSFGIVNAYVCYPAHVASHKIIMYLSPFKHGTHFRARYLGLGITAALALASAAPLKATNQAPSIAPMIASAWATKGGVTFLADKSAIVLAQGGSAELNATTFSNGTIEFDMKSPGGNVGLTFHMQGNTGDALYFRPSADGAASDDCVQYMRIDHGIFEWDLFGDNQARASFGANVWNHVKLSVNGRSMRVWVNGAPVSAPHDHLLVGAFDSGTIKLHGPASYAHFTITPATPTDTPERPLTAAVGDAHFITRWLASNAFIMPSIFDAKLGQNTGVAPSIKSLPATDAFQHVLLADPTGLVNVTAALGEAQKGNAIVATWLKAVVMSEHAQVKHVSIGWTREAWVFVNGELAYADKNLYGVPAASKTPDGRLSLDNGAFDLPLKKGSNQIDVLLDDNFGGGIQHFGWGLMMRFPDLDDIQLAAH